MVLAKVVSGIVVNAKNLDPLGDEAFGIELIALAFVAALAIAAGVWWGRTGPVSRLIPETGLAIVVAGVVAVVCGAWAAGGSPFEDGLGFFLQRLLFFWGVGIAGVALGYVALMLFGADLRSRQLKNAEKYYSARAKRH